MKNIKRLFDIIDRSLFRIDPPLNYDRTIEAITKLATMIDEYESPDDDNSELWALGECGNCSLDNLLVGAYWFCTDYQAGQSSPEYACQFAIGQFFEPGMTSGPEPDSSEIDAYNALETISPQSERTEF